MLKTQREILAAFPDEEVDLLIDLKGFVIGEIGELLTTTFIKDLADLSHQWANLTVYTNNIAVIATVYTYASFSDANSHVSGARTREGALERLKEASKREEKTKRVL